MGRQDSSNKSCYTQCLQEIALPTRLQGLFWVARIGCCFQYVGPMGLTTCCNIQLTMQPPFGAQGKSWVASLGIYLQWASGAIPCNLSPTSRAEQSSQSLSVPSSCRRPWRVWGCSKHQQWLSDISILSFTECNNCFTLEIVSKHISKPIEGKS